MKKRMMRTGVILLCLVLLAGLTLTGCGPAPVKIGKAYGQDITSKDLDYMVNAYCWYTGYDKSTIVTSADEAKTLYEQLLDTFVEFKVSRKIADDQKIVLTADELKAIDTDLKSRLDKQLAPIESSYADISKTKTSVNPKAEAQKALDEQMQKNGFNTEDMRRFLTDVAIYRKVVAKVQDAVTVSDTELKASYDTLVTSQKEAFKDLAAYEYAKSMVEQGQGDPVVYIPAGIRYVKHILISLPEDIVTQIQQAADDASKKKLRDDNLPAIKAKADEALAKVKSGEDFDALMAQYGQDPGMQQEPGKTVGYEIDSETGFVAEFKTAALALAKIGDTTDLVASDYGYHIIKYVGDVPAGPVSFDTVKESLKTSVLAAKKDKAWTDAMAQWKKDAGVTTDISKMPLPSFSPSPSPSVEPSTTPAATDSPSAPASPAPSESVAPSGSPVASPTPSAK